MRNTPNPGTYTTTAWTETLPSCSMPFRACTREKHFSTKHQHDGLPSQPGIYEVEDSIQKNSKQNKTYGFRSLSREFWGAHMVGKVDKELNLSPGQYDSNPSGSRGLQVRSANFLSSISRFPTPTEHTHSHTRHVWSTTPPPTAYSAPKPLSEKDQFGRAVSSNLGSRTPRFPESRKAVGPKLGPGCYTRPTPTLSRVVYPRSSSAPPSDALPDV